MPPKHYHNPLLLSSDEVLYTFYWAAGAAFSSLVFLSSRTNPTVLPEGDFFDGYIFRSVCVGFQLVYV